VPRRVDDGGKFPGPPEANRKYNGLAIAGFICSFLVSLLGLILSIVGLNQIKKQGGKGKGLAIAGITFNYRVDGDTLVYEYVLDDSYASLGDTFASSLDAMDSTYQSTANLLGSMCKASSGKASLRVIMHTQSGQSLYDKTWTEK